MSRVSSFFVTILLVLLSVSLCSCALISSITPTSSGLSGGQVLTITGSGFMRGGVDGTTSVFIGNKMCQTIMYYCTDTQWVCVVPSAPGMRDSTVPIVVTSVGIGFNEFALCRTPSGTCNFDYRDYLTPRVYEYTQSGGRGGVVPLVGEWRGANLFSNFNIRINGVHLELDYEANAEWETLYNNTWGSSPYLVGKLNNEPFNDRYLYGYVNGQTAGYFNVSANVDVDVNGRGRGTAFFPSHLFDVKDDGTTVYNWVQHPVIETVTGRVGGSNGGFPVTIQGSGFSNDCSENVVRLQEQECVPTTCTQEQIVCVPTAFAGASSAVSYPGSRGVLSEVWYKVNWDSSLRKTFQNIDNGRIAPELTTTQTSHFRSHNDIYTLTWFERESALLQVPYTGSYTFYITGQETGELFLSADANGTSAKSIASFWWNQGMLWDQPNQVSAPQYLQANTPYYIRTIYNHRGWQNPLTVSLKLDSSSVDQVNTPLPPLTPQQKRYSTIKAIQRLAIVSDVRREQFQLVFNNVFPLSTFRLQYGTKLTAPMFIGNLTASLLSSALSTVILSPQCVYFDIINVIKSVPLGYYTWTIQFRCPGSSLFGPISIVNDNIQGNSTMSWSCLRTQTSSVPVSGQFRVGWSANTSRTLDPADNYLKEWTTNINFDADAVTFQQQLMTIANITDILVSADGNAQDGRYWTVTFYDPYGRVPSLQFTNTSLKGENVRIVVSSLREGEDNDLFWDPIPADFLTVPATQQRIEVTTRGVRSVCTNQGKSYLLKAATNNDCTYTYDDTLTPTITSVSPSSIIAATTLTVQGTGFSTVSGDNIIGFNFGSSSASPVDFQSVIKCLDVTAVSDTELTCTVPDISSGVYTVQVLVKDAGLNTPTTSQVTATYRVDSYYPTTGSVGGGSLIVFTGTGFTVPTSYPSAPSSGSNENGGDVIQIGGFSCELLQVTVTSIICRSPALAAADFVQVLSFDGVALTNFTYDSALTPTITNLEPTVVSSAVTSLITITGTGFVASTAGYDSTFVDFAGQHDFAADNIFSAFLVNFGDRWCKVLTVSSTQIVCRLARAAPPNLHSNTNDRVPTVYVVGQGAAIQDSASELKLDIALRIHSISPTHGSLAGGAYLTITGSGFKPPIKAITDHSTTIDPDYGTVHITLLGAPDGQFPADNTTKFSYSHLDVGCTIKTFTFYEIVCVVAPVGAFSFDVNNGGLVGAVSLSLNNLRTVCGSAQDSDCQFTFLADDTPSITDVSPLEGVDGTIITITGTDFNRTDATVYIGHEVCPIVSQSETEIQCQVVGKTASVMPVYVWFSNTGFAEAVTQFNYSHLLVISTQDVNVGSFAGNTFVTLSGSGFAVIRTDNIIQLNGKTAPVLFSSPTQVTFLTPSYAVNFKNPAISSFLSNLTIQVANYYTLDTWFSPDVWGDSTADYASDVWRDIVHANPLVKNYTTDSCGFNTSCAFWYNSTHTPEVTSISPKTGFAGTVLTIAGIGFGSSVGASTVDIGGAACAINTTSWSNTRFTCTLGNSPAGTFQVNVYIDGYGQAYTASSSVGAFTPSIEVTSISPVTGGYGGGTVLTLAGRGFATELTKDSIVDVCNAACIVQSTSYNEIKCVTNPLVTLERIRRFGATRVVVATGTAFGTGGSATNYPKAFDGNVESIYSAGSARTCSIGLDLGTSTSLALTRIRFYPKYQKAALMANGKFEASNNGVNWTYIASTPARPHEGWNFIDIVDTNTLTPDVTQSWRFFRYTPSQAFDSYCTVGEFEYQGFRVASISQTLSDPLADGANCAVSVRANVVPPRRVNQFWSTGPVQSVRAFTPSNFTYSLALTPTVFDISPSNGTALGGTSVTLTGSGFVASDLISNTVSFNDYSCLVTDVNAAGTQIICTTSWRSEIRAAPSGREVAVFAGDASGYAILIPNPSSPQIGQLVNYPVPPVYRYLDKWSELTTWRFQEIPVDGDTVIIPQGQTVILDVSPPRLFFLLIQGSLFFANKDLNLEATYIFIQGGTLSIGTELQPYLNKATITLHGDRYKTIEGPHFGNKMIAVTDIKYTTMTNGLGALPLSYLKKSGTGVNLDALQAYDGDNFDGKGRLDIHGRPRRRVWTKVDQTIRAGDNFLVTAEEVDWEAGETLVITSGSGNMWETEVMTVQSLDVDLRTIYFTTAFQFDHLSEIYKTLGHTADMRCEVGILSRNIVVQGDEQSDHQMYGSHIMGMRGSILRVENMETRRCGQSFNLGRYCIHYHLMGNCPECYIRHNSIHDSFQRATTVHGTHFALVENNIAYRVHGHNFFVEDGNERHNVIQGNLGILTLRLTSMLKSDMKPATFWMSSPENFWRHNIAAGCTNDGYWFELPGHPNGPSFTTTICPVNGHVGEFFNNTAKNNGVHGLRIYPTYTPLLDPCDSGSGPAPQYFYNFTSFRNGAHGIFGKQNGDLHHINAKLLENGGDELNWVKLGPVRYEYNPHVVNSLFVATTDPVLRPASWKKGIWTPQHERFYISGARFENYGNRGAIAGCNDCEADDSLRQGGYTIRVEKLDFVNSAKRVVWTGPYKEIFFDLDASLTGIVNGTVFPYFPFNEWPECKRQGIQYDFGLLCDNTVRVRRQQFDGHSPGELDWHLITIGQSSGPGALNNSFTGRGSVKFLPKEIYGWVVPMVTSKWYNVTFSGRIDWRSLNMRFSEPELVKDLSIDQSNEEWMGFTFNYTDYRYNYKVVAADNTIREWLNGTLPEPTDDMGTSTLGNTIGQNGTWHMMFNTINATQWNYQVKVSALQCPLVGCPLPPSPLLGNQKRWSDPTAWPSGQVPDFGDSVTIDNTMWILLDVSPPPLGKLEIFGKLTFEDASLDITLSAFLINVFGSLEIGSPSAPYKRKATIILSGLRTSPTLVVSNAQFLGNKVMAVFGNLTMYGQPKNYTWTRLAATATPGSRTITVKDPVDWVAGNDIVITPTEYDNSQVETVKIASVSGNVITLQSPLTYNHYGVNLQVNGKNIELAAAVGLLTRNIRFTSDLTGDETYGAHLVVSEVKSDDPLNPQSNVGTIDAQYVEFASTGQREMEHAGLYLNYFQEAGYFFSFPENANKVINTIIGCAFSYTLNYGVKADGARNVVLRDNVFHRTYRSSVIFDEFADDGVFVNNLVAGTLRSPDETTDWYRPLASFYLDGRIAQLINNFAAGSQDVGFVYHAEPCGTSPTKIDGNVAHANKIGVWILADPVKCLAVNGFTAYKSAHIGVLAVDGLSNLKLNGIVVSDNHIGISLNFFRSAAHSFADITNSYILGSTIASTCDASLICSAANKEDVFGVNCNSVYGPSYRRVGVMTTQYTNRAKTCKIDGGLPVCRPPTTPERMCSLPWEMRYGVPHGGASQNFTLTSTTFAFWNADDCGMKSKAFAWNPTQRDNTPHIFTSQLSWVAVQSAAKFGFGYEAGISDGNCESACDGLDQLVVTDTDGTANEVAIGPNSKGHSILANNPLLADPSCTSVPEWGGIQCLNVPYRTVVWQNTDGFSEDRHMGPLQSTRLSYTSENRTNFAVGPFNDHCPMRFFFNQYPFQVVPGNVYHWVMQGSNSASTRIHFRSYDTSEKLIARIFYTQPFTVTVFVNGVERTNNNNSIVPTFSSEPGAFQFNAQQRHLTVLFRGGADSHYYDIVTTPLIQVSLTLAIDYSTFLGPTLVQNLATLLQIPPSTIKIVSVQPGSTIVELQIIDAAPVSINTTSADTSFIIERLTVISDLIVNLAGTGVMNETTVGYPIVNMYLGVPTVSNSSDPAADNSTVVLQPVLFNNWVPPTVTPTTNSTTGGTNTPPTNNGGSGSGSGSGNGGNTNPPGTTTPPSNSTNNNTTTPPGTTTPPAAASSSGESFPVWAIAVAAAGGALLLLGLIAFSYYLTRRPAVMTKKVMSQDTPRSYEPPLSPSNAVQPQIIVDDTAVTPQQIPAYTLNADGSSNTTSKVHVPLLAPTGGEIEKEGSSSGWKSSRSQTGPTDMHRMEALEELEPGQFRVTRDYYPKFADELELKAGDVVVVLDSSSPIWYIGLNMRTHKRGSFPKTCVSAPQAAAGVFASSEIDPTTGQVSGARAVIFHTPVDRRNSKSISPRRDNDMPHLLQPPSSRSNSGNSHDPLEVLAVQTDPTRTSPRDRAPVPPAVEQVNVEQLPNRPVGLKNSRIESGRGNQQ